MRQIPFEESSTGILFMVACASRDKEIMKLYLDEGLDLGGFIKLHCFFFLIPLTSDFANTSSCSVEEIDKFLAGRQLLISKDAYFCNSVN